MNAPHKTRLAQVRRAAGLTQLRIADALGVSKATYSSWETGRAEMGADRIIALSELLECTPNDILGYKADEGRRFAVLTQDEEEFVSLFRSLPPNIREDVLDIMRTTVKGWRIR